MLPYNSWTSPNQVYSYPSIMPASPVSTQALTYPASNCTRNYTRDYPPIHADYTGNYIPNYPLDHSTAYAPNYRPISVLGNLHRATPLAPSPLPYTASLQHPCR